MFKQSIDDRLSSWAKHRDDLDTAADPLLSVWEFWKDAPFVPYNNKVDPFYQKSWPSPWQIIVDNHYDDFTKALMIAWTLKLTNKFKDSAIEIRSLIDKQHNSVHNVVYVDNLWVVNYLDNGPVLAKDIPDSFFLENLIELKLPR